MKNSNWLLLQTPPSSAAFNMALDEALLHWHSEGKIPPVLRLYEWDNPTLSLGYFQRSKELNETYISDKNMSVVRRLTGGRTVLHDDELTYSVVLKEDYENMPKNVVEAYKVLSEGLLIGLQNIGIPVRFSLPENIDIESLKNPKSSVCFDASSYYEIILEGKKVIGSAQTRQRGVILQHGSIPLSFDVQAMFASVNFPSEKIRNRLEKSFGKKAGAINEILETEYTISRIREGLIYGFSKALSVEFDEFILSESQLSYVEKLEQKYLSEEWNTYR